MSILPPSRAARPAARFSEWCSSAERGERGKERAYGAGLGITFEPAVTAAVYAGARSDERGGKVTVTASLKNYIKSYEVLSWGKGADPDASRLPVIWNGELDGGRGRRFPSAHGCESVQLRSVRRYIAAGRALWGKPAHLGQQ